MSACMAVEAATSISWSSEPWRIAVGTASCGKSGRGPTTSAGPRSASDAVGVVVAVVHQASELAQPGDVSGVARRGRCGLVLHEEFDGLVAVAGAWGVEPTGEQVETVDEVGAWRAVDQCERQHPVRCSSARRWAIIPPMDWPTMCAASRCSASSRPTVSPAMSVRV